MNMEYQVVKLVDASDLVQAVNEKFNLRWPAWRIAYHCFYDRSDRAVRYYYFGNECDDDDRVDDNEFLVIQTLREQFPDDDYVYIHLGR